MKKLIITAAALMIAVAAHAQGQFTFNTRNTGTSTAIRFTDAGGNFLSGDNYFVQVFAGADVASLQPIPGAVLPLNRTGNGAGYTNPFLAGYNVPGITTGNAVIGYQAYQGAASGIASATLTSPLIAYANGATSGTTPLSVAVTLPPNLPNEVVLGTGTVALVPEPTTLALGLLGLGGLLAFRRRQ